MSDTARGPIFLIGLQRSGTTQAWNILQSQPDTLWPAGELHQVLRPGRAMLNLRANPGFVALQYARVALQSGDLLKIHHPSPPNRLQKHARWLHQGLLRAIQENQEQRRAFRADLCTPKACSDRLLLKVMNYGAALWSDLAFIYRDATFIFVIRDLVAICEGHLARGQDPAKTIALCNAYARICTEILNGATKVYAFSFEDFLAQPEQAAEALLRAAGYRPYAHDEVVVQDRTRTQDKHGKIVSKDCLRQLALNELADHVRPDVNRAAYARLGPKGVRELKMQLANAQAQLDIFNNAVGRPAAKFVTGAAGGSK